MGVVTLNDEGVVVAIGEWQGESAGTEFYNGVVTAGLVNAHCHLELSYLKGRTAPYGGIAGFIGQMAAGRRPEAPLAERMAAMRAADGEMRQEGTVAVGDVGNTADSFPVKQGSPVRYHSFVETLALDAAVAGQRMQRAQQLCAEAAQRGLPAGIAPHAAYSLSEPLLAAAMEAANRSGLLSVHNQESDDENRLFESGAGALYDALRAARWPLPPTTGRRAIHRLLPLIDPRTQTLFVHNVATDEADYDAATDRLPRLTWVLCPNSNLYIGRRLPPVGLFYRKAAQVAIGTDSLASNHRLSVWEELKTIARHFPQVPLPVLLQWATLNGARALQQDATLGSLCVGKKPGVVLIENVDFSTMQLTADSRLVPLHNS
jgi:cytosine/adenosine deaminase-related metal-dependent hydrolase